MKFKGHKSSSPENIALTYDVVTIAEARRLKIAGDIVSRVLAGYSGKVAVKLWDGSLAHGQSYAPCAVVIRESGAIRQLVLQRNILLLADRYLANAIDVEGDLESLFSLKTYLRNLDLSFFTKMYLLIHALRLPAKISSSTVKNRFARSSPHRNSRSSIEHHYDVSNDFYSLWLDPEMVYSCAYFRDEQQSLATAQREKLDYLCRKLRLQPGQNLLDIGCGWGALAIHAARNYDVNVHGITLSEAQQRFAHEKVHREGLEKKVNIEFLDYRDLSKDVKYDRVVSVGMFEHVGVKNYPTYFRSVKCVLKPGGLFLNHGITSETSWQDSPLTRFINRYIFPDGELARLSDVTDAMEKAGFEVLDTEALRRHYVYTLRHWVRALEKNREEAIRKTSEVTYRLWRLYMSGSAHYFEEGSIGVYQLLVSHKYDKLTIPLRRDDLYTNRIVDTAIS